ncbi:CD166 antigen homolog A [Takifugu rubripes]|uniref:Neurolin-a n=1 Tax=Takifugu rubripes TaxID=31033 RepID=A0S0K9_TAKRU|nr:CD166 antigen homolog A [Takifugu rubripes]ABC50098.1 neurolin-a [Takifugu rubripes]|eukprot:NP_001092128.1 CD166 antigen [Takifugu rubripes]
METHSSTAADPLGSSALVNIAEDQRVADCYLAFRATDTVTALYGEPISIPCNNGIPPPEDLIFIKWKYEKDDGSPGDLLIKQARSEQATIQATDHYAQRVSIDDKLSLLIKGASLKDQKTFTCMVVSENDLMEYPVSVVVHKKPSQVEVMDQSVFLQKDKPVTLGTCVAVDANPAATLTWKKNGKPLTADGKAVIITPSMKLDPATGLSTTSSTLQYTASKDDIGAVFACASTHELDNQEIKLDPLPVHYPPEEVSLETVSEGPIIEGDNVTLKCQADGNPLPTSFYFHIQGQKTLVEDSNSYTINAISRDAASEYKCSLADNEKMEASLNIVVNYLDLTLSPTGKVVKTVGESLPVTVEKTASGDVQVSWTKDRKAVKEPKFSSLAYADSGLYVCEASMAGLVRRQSFDLVVEGKPVISSLTKHRADEAKYKVLTCEAEGAPEPSFQWSINGTNEESSYTDGRATHKITVTPRVNLSVTCTVSNRLGEDSRTINVSSIFEEDVDKKDSQEDSEDQSKVIVGVVVGLLIVAALMGIIYWFYMKNYRRGSWKTGEKDMATSEEIKKLEENSHNV